MCDAVEGCPNVHTDYPHSYHPCSCGNAVHIFNCIGVECSNCEFTHVDDRPHMDLFELWVTFVRRENGQ